MNGYLQIVFCDHANNRFVTLGGAGFDTMRETRARFARIPGVLDSDLVLDLMSDKGILTDKYVTRETAETLLGDTFDNLLALAKLDKEGTP
jgi:hypothetical protein